MCAALDFVAALSIAAHPRPNLLPLALYLRGQTYTPRAVDGVLAWVAAGRDVRECEWLDESERDGVLELLAGRDL